jgi:NTE family protein
LYSTPQIDFIYPTLSLKKDSSYNLKLFIRKARDFQLDLGGHFSSRPVNTGYVGLTYKMVGSAASSIHAESYFGKFYGSVKTDVNIELPSIYPVSASAYFVMNRWDYFRSFATFFEDVQPSFLVQNEMYAGVQFKHPIGNNSKSTFNFRYFELDDEYYQNANFTNKDTADLTSFYGSSISWEFTRNSLNRKQFANSGHYFQFKARLVEGRENTTPGSTSAFEETFRKYHSWFNVTSEFQSFVFSNKSFHLGIHAKGQLTSQSLFANYTASLLSLPAFSIIPDQETYFLPEFRSHQHLGGGLNLVFSIRKNIDYRIDAYYYQPFLQLQKNDDGTIQYIKPFKGETFLASTSLIFHSIVGPIRATLNYFPTQKYPFAFQLSYGYVLFNERAIR